MALPIVTQKKISSYVRSDLEKALATLPQQGTEVRFDPIKVEKALQPPTPEMRQIVPVLTPPFTKDVVIVPPPTAAETSSLLPLLVAGAIVLMQ
jgi:hypothetical protein|tara:strand:- start:242 stop:523 length:282 start_codon:yes stop_codon:yes gene_type:complete